MIMKDKVVLITGAGRGIGRAMAIMMAQEGAKVVVNDLGAGVGGEETGESPAEEVVSTIRAAGGEAVINGDAEIEAAELMARKAAALFEAGEPCGAEANMAKMLCAEAAWNAGEACMQTHGGFAFAKEYDIERKWREARLYLIAPISTNMVLSYIGQHVLGMPKSY